MKKAIGVVIAVVVLLILGCGAYALLHKSKSPSPTSSSNSNEPTITNSVLTTKTSTSLGKYLAEPSGQALYTYGGDKVNVSNCTSTCLVSWPAYVAKGSTTNLPTGIGTIKRVDNGDIQYTYNSMPLYTFVGDHSGQPTGNGVSDFGIAKPTTTSSSSSSW